MPVSVKITVPADLQKLYARLQNAEQIQVGIETAKKVAPDLTRDLVENAQEQAGSGPYARGWLAAPAGSGLKVTNSATYARWVEFPTKAHPISARPGTHAVTVKAHTGVSKNGVRYQVKAFTYQALNGLAWVKGRGAFSAFAAPKAMAAANWIRARSVQHPGTKGKFVFKFTLRKTGGPQILAALAVEARKFLKGE